MKFKRNLIILSAMLIGILIVVAGCLPTPTTPAVDVPTNGTISIAAAAVTTNDTTPTLTLSSTGATHMVFSGNGTTWSSWVVYATTYSSFNITTGEGSTPGDGTKIVYVKFKNNVGESTKVYDSIILDTVAPKLSTAAYTDVDSSGTVNSGDKITFTFIDEMDTTTVTSSNVATNLLLSDSKSYGTSPAVSWDSGLKICYVTLGTSPTVVVGTTTVNPSDSVKDTAGNADASTAVTISSTTTATALFSVSIVPSLVTTTAGATTVTLTATALNTALGNITSLCTFIWSISGTAGGIVTPTTYTAIYTPPASGTGVDTVSVTAVKTGTTTPIKTAYAYITVGTGTAAVDPAKLFVRALTSTAKYTALPAGATSVTVYSNATPDPVLAVAAGAKATIILNDVWTTMTGIPDNEYIYFMIAYSDGTTSPVTADGQMPDAPDVTALANIQATSKNTVTSTAAGNVVATDNITLYISGIQKSNPTLVGSTMTFVYNLAAADAPAYTRTNANGHESTPSGPDGAIVQIAGAAYAGGILDGIVETGDIITITYSANVTVATVASLNFVLEGTTITASLAQGIPTTALLTITGGPYDLSAQATVNFNLANENIVDGAGGGNWAFEHASGIVWTPTVDF